MQTIIIDGNIFSDKESFYCEIDRKFTKGLNWKTGHNLNALNDLLCGGFGVFEYQENIKLKWIDFSVSKINLDSDFIELICSTIKEHHHIDFETKD